MDNSNTTTYNFIEIENVRICPPSIQLERSKLNSKFTMQNVGNVKVFIRICEPKIKNYRVDCFPRGKFLCPGLRITTRVRVEYTPEMPSEYLLPIYINDRKHDFLIMIKPKSASIVVVPERLDFGLVNAGTIHNTLTVIIENRGPKDQVFQVNTSDCDESIVVEPIRGLVKGYSSSAVNVRVVSFVEQVIDTTFLIKCGQMTTTVPVKARVIISRLEAIHPNAAEHFTLLEFAPTYFGVKSVVNLFVKNYSASVQMFSTSGEVHNKRDNLADLRKRSINFKFFSVHPGDGMFQEDETKLFQFTFSPKEIDMSTKNIQFYYCTIVIHRFQCGSLNIEGNIFDELCTTPEDMRSISVISKQSISLEVATKYLYTPSTLESLQSFNTTTDEEKFFNFRSDITKDFLRIHLYATAEVAVVTVVPEKIVLRELMLQQCELRLVEVTNRSEKLPIYLCYKKVPFVFLDREKVLLQPCESLQLAVNIIPSKLGTIETEIAFHLMFYDCPRLDSSLKVVGEVAVSLIFDVIAQTQYPHHQLNFGLSPNYIKEVGKHCQGIRFNTNIVRAKTITINNCTKIDGKCNDLVAFPNDTQQSLRPWRSKDACKTIFTRTGRYVAPVDSAYELNLFDYCFKKEVKTYYTNYLRSQMTKSMSSSDDQREYHVTKDGAILCTDFSCSQPCPIKHKQIKKGAYFLPLTPQEMDNIIIYPPIIQTKEIASHSMYTFKIFVQNKNHFAVRFILTSDRQNLVFVDGNRHTIGGTCGYYTVQIAYHATHTGYYTSNLFVIINESTVLTIPILARVITKKLHLSDNKLLFNKHETRKYLKIKNKLNVPITFNWTVTNLNFSIEPYSGCVQEGRRIICIVRYDCSIEGPSETEAQLHSGDGNVQRVDISCNFVHNNLCLVNNEVDFANIPLNETVTNLLLLKNNDNVSLKFCVDDTNIPSNLKIRPMQGLLPGFCQLAIYITAKFENCVTFHYNLKINGLRGGFVEASITGTVVYPDVIISPGYFNLPKISASMTASMQFTLKNISVCCVRVHFEMEDYDEFAISENEHPFCDSLLKELVIPSNVEKTLYVHFFPSGTSSYLFYLPIRINNILGPPIYGDVISTKVGYYLTEELDRCQCIETPSTIPTVKVRTLVAPPKVFLTRRFISFVVNGSEICKKEHEFTLVIWNTQSQPDDVCLRIEQVKHPIYINYKSGKQVDRNDCAMVFSLEPNDKTVFTVSFQPEKFDFGRYRAVIPVYLRSDETVEEHRTIIIDAVYNKPVIKTNYNESLTSLEQIRFNKDYVEIIEPIPLIESNMLNVVQELRFINHLPDCEIQEKDLEDYIIHVMPNTKTVVNEDEYRLFVTIKTKLRIHCAFKIKWRLSCSCGGLWEKYVNGVVDDSILTTYATANFFTNWPECPLYHSKLFYYPLFPAPLDDDYIYMNECVSVAKDWLNSQVFFGQWNYEIPESINYANFEPPSPESVRRQTQFSRIPLIHILANLLGPQILAYFILQDTPNNHEEKIIYLYLVYSKIIKLLEDHGTRISYLEPEYLFNYNFFMYYKMYFYASSAPPFRHTECITEFEDFERLSRQTWLDIILQIYKSLYLEKIFSKHENLCYSGRLAETPIAEYFAEELPKKCEFFLSQTESKILNWLQFHYNKHRGDVWTNAAQLGDINIGLFNKSLHDGIVFAVVLVTYCPYFKHRINDFYLKPESQEEAFHNTITLIKCLEIIDYTFVITPEQIIDGNPLRLLMFSAYLFEILPFMYPIESMILKAGLSINSTSMIEIYNENEFPIAYKPIFVGIHRDLFSTNEVLYEIQPKKKRGISIIYFAKFAVEVECTLVLSGEVTGYRYVTNKCISLIGKPELNYATSTIKYKQEIFQVENIDFDIQSPYTVAAGYDMQQTYDTIHEPYELSSILYHFERDRVACARLVATNSSYDFDENGRCKIYAVVGTTSMSNITMWMYFRSSVVGDFAIKFVSIIKKSKRNETLIVQLPKYIQELRIRPDNLVLKIPNRNSLFFNAMKNLLVSLSKGDEAALWKRILETPIGVNILESYLTTTDPNTRLGTPIRCKSAEYTVIVEEGADVILPEKIVFDDECSSGFAKIPLKLKDVEEYPRDFKFTMESKETQRIRFYYVAFTH